MPGSSHGGKGDRSRVTDLKKYQDSLLWKKSRCCSAPMKVSGNGRDLWCVKCARICKPKDDDRNPFRNL